MRNVGDKAVVQGRSPLKNQTLSYSFSGLQNSKTPLWLLKFLAQVVLSGWHIPIAWVRGEAAMKRLLGLLLVTVFSGTALADVGWRAWSGLTELQGLWLAAGLIVALICAPFLMKDTDTNLNDIGIVPMEDKEESATLSELSNTPALPNNVIVFPAWKASATSRKTGSDHARASEVRDLRMANTLSTSATTSPLSFNTKT
jgi:hypothetical protein